MDTCGRISKAAEVYDHWHCLVTVGGSKDCALPQHMYPSI
jgi:hypothetical protein